MRELDEAGIVIDDIGLRRPTLDDVFLTLTGHGAELDEARRMARASTPAGEDRRPHRWEDGMTGTASLSPTAASVRSSSMAIMTQRNLRRVPRIPELAVFAILQSIMFVLLFAYVFGNAIPLPGGGDYRNI